MYYALYTTDAIYLSYHSITMYTKCDGVVSLAVSASYTTGYSGGCEISRIIHSRGQPTEAD